MFCVYTYTCTDRRNEEYDDDIYKPGPDDDDYDQDLDNTIEGVEDDEIDALVEDNEIAIKQELMDDELYALAEDKEVAIARDIPLGDCFNLLDEALA